MTLSTHGHSHNTHIRGRKGRKLSHVAHSCTECTFAVEASGLAPPLSQHISRRSSSCRLHHLRPRSSWHCYTHREVATNSVPSFSILSPRRSCLAGTGYGNWWRISKEKAKSLSAKAWFHSGNGLLRTLLGCPKTGRCKVHPVMNSKRSRAKRSATGLW